MPSWETLSLTRFCVLIFLPPALAFAITVFIASDVTFSERLVSIGIGLSSSSSCSVPIPSQFNFKSSVCLASFKFLTPKLQSSPSTISSDLKSEIAGNLQVKEKRTIKLKF
uniref:Uncharacterized protein n=1 Tax=Glossina brevipalpis TaxID=37001 RepID=A0A1A9W0T1_9MUSC